MRIQHTAGLHALGGRIETASRKLQHRLNLLPSHIVLLDDLFYARAQFKILKYRGDGHASTTKICELHGYRGCDTDSREVAYEKIYELGSTGVEHIARQLRDGQWTSKIGEWEDIRHETARALEGVEYGEVAKFMKRHRKDWLE